MLRLLVVTVLLALGPAMVADAGDPAAPGMLRFFNRDIITFHETYFGIPPSGRAAQGAQRIREALAKGGPGDVAMINMPEGLTVTVDGA